MTSGSVASFARQFVVVLKDSRLWIVVLPFLLIVSLVFSLVGPRLAAVLSLTLGVVASYLINQIDRLPGIGELSSLKNLTKRILIPAGAGILIIPGAEVLTRIWLMPWYWFHSSDQNPNCSYLMGGAVWNWLGFLVCGALLAALTRERSTFATIAGASVFIPLSFTDIFTGNLSQQTLSVLASSCKWLDMKDSDVKLLRFGMAIGLVVRVLLAIFVARLVSSWLISRKKA